MAATGEEARRRRAEARERRRSAMTKPFEELDRDAGPKRESSEPGEPAKTLKHAAATAAVGAIAAGLAGAGKAWLERRAADGDAQPEVDRGPAETGDGSDLAG